jgi:hypothetical protein
MLAHFCSFASSQRAGSDVLGIIASTGIPLRFDLFPNVFYVGLSHVGNRADGGRGILGAPDAPEQRNPMRQG